MWTEIIYNLKNTLSHKNLACHPLEENSQQKIRPKMSIWKMSRGLVQCISTTHKLEHASGISEPWLQSPQKSHEARPLPGRRVLRAPVAMGGLDMPVDTGSISLAPTPCGNTSLRAGHGSSEHIQLV